MGGSYYCKMCGVGIWRGGAVWIAFLWLTIGFTGGILRTQSSNFDDKFLEYLIGYQLLKKWISLHAVSITRVFDFCNHVSSVSSVQDTIWLEQ